MPYDDLNTIVNDFKTDDLCEFSHVVRLLQKAWKECAELSMAHFDLLYNGLFGCGYTAFFQNFLPEGVSLVQQVFIEDALNTLLFSKLSLNDLLSLSSDHRSVKFESPLQHPWSWLAHAHDTTEFMALLNSDEGDILVQHAGICADLSALSTSTTCKNISALHLLAHSHPEGFLQWMSRHNGVVLHDADVMKAICSYPVWVAGSCSKEDFLEEHNVFDILIALGYADELGRVLDGLRFAELPNYSDLVDLFVKSMSQSNSSFDRTVPSVAESAPATFWADPSQANQFPEQQQFFNLTR